MVFHRGDPADALHVVRKGRFDVHITTAQGDTAILAVLGPGESFGEAALLTDDGVRSASVMAMEPSETVSIHRLDFDRVRREHPEANDVLLRLFAEKVQRLSDLLTEALYVPADKRVRRRLADQAALYDSGREGEVSLTQEQLAYLAGTSRATVNKVLREEERRGTIALRRGGATVIDPDELARRGR
jgi:CRP-like cAMP-binding protein